MKSRVLLVDDDVRVVQKVGQFLKLSGHEVVTADSGEAALSLLKAEDCDVVLLDQHMPGKYDGMATLQHIAAEHTTIPVIMMTGEKAVPFIISAIKAGAFHYLPKPFEFDE